MPLRRRASPRRAGDRRGIGCGHEGLADEDGVVPGRPEAAGVVSAAHTRLGDLHHSVRDDPCHPNRPLVIDLERHEVSLVHADQRRTGGERVLELDLVMDLDERVEPELQREVVELRELGRRERGGDQQHAVRPHQPGVARRRGRRR